VGSKKYQPGRSTKQTHTIRNWAYSQMGGYKARTYIISEKATHSSSLSQPTAPYNRAVHHGARPPNVLAQPRGHRILQGLAERRGYVAPSILHIEILVDARQLLR
jgi:hypothetical protein